jgi:hypothetical protein
VGQQAHGHSLAVAAWLEIFGAIPQYSVGNKKRPPEGGLTTMRTKIAGS